MSLVKFCFGANSSELMKKKVCRESIFINRKYDPAISGIDITTGAIYYSLRKLVCIDMKEMKSELLPTELQDSYNLFLFLKDNFCDFFDELQKRTDGVPPKIIDDVKQESKRAA